MFGYVKPDVRELLVKEHEFYKATYCGICRTMKKYTGSSSRITLTYDSVFLALIRMAYMDDSQLRSGRHICPLHPLKKRLMLEDNPALEYTAKAFAVLSYYKLEDDVSDERLIKRLGVGCLKPIAKRAMKLSGMTEIESVAKEKLEKIAAFEREGTASVDIPATLFGELLGEIFSYGLCDSDRLVCYRVGYHLGRFIYSVDAAEDYKEDVRLGRYNPFRLLYGDGGLSEDVRKAIHSALLLECRELEGAVNLVPFERKITVENIVNNIIYLGLTKRMEFLLESEDVGKEKEND